MQSAVSAHQNPKPAAVAETSPSKLSRSEVVQLKAKADTGDVDAQATLGRAHQDGDGVSRDDGLAARWYLRAAEQGNVSAQNSLGTMYRMGSGVEQNKAEAVNSYRKAARQQYPSAMFNLATAYCNGDGVGIDDVFAFAWFLLAQKNGSQAANDAVSWTQNGHKNRESAEFKESSESHYQ
jgi:TPR repeat protein